MTYSDFLEVYSRNEGTVFGDMAKEAAPWLLNNMTWLVLIGTVLALCLNYVYDKLKKVAKDDNDLMEKYILLRKKGVL